MNTLTLLLIILGVLLGFGIIKAIINAIHSVRLRTYKIKNSDLYVVNVKSIKEATKIAKEKYFFMHKGYLEETDLNIPKRFRNQVISEEALTEFINTDYSDK